MLFALMLLGRHAEVDELASKLLAETDDTALLAHVTYALAILNARLNVARLDFDAARTWIAKSKAYTERLPASASKVVNLAFLKNTLALVEMRQGRTDVAEQLLLDAIDYLAREAPERYRQGSVILWHNLARLHIATGRPDAALDDLAVVLAHDPGDSAGWFDRGLLHQRAGRLEAALADYDTAIRWGPPQVEAHVNRGQVRAALRRYDEALADYDRALVLEPDSLDARIGRACLLYERGDHDGARAELGGLLPRKPDDARLLCLQGLFALNDNEADVAFELFTRAIAADANLVEPLANRAIVSYRRGDFDAALADLDRALALREDPDIRHNRERVLTRLRQQADRGMN
jgi:tetratricopeptide (TPR) repeat protein